MPANRHSLPVWNELFLSRPTRFVVEEEASEVPAETIPESQLQEQKRGPAETQEAGAATPSAADVPGRPGSGVVAARSGGPIKSLSRAAGVRESLAIPLCNLSLTLSRYGVIQLWMQRLACSSRR